MLLFPSLVLAVSALGLTAHAQSPGSVQLNRPRRLTRFTQGHADNDICWDRNGEDGFFSVVDTHNHFRPFGGPSVPFDEYLEWMTEHGILFSTMFGIGQLIKKSNPNDPECCYYLHCPTYKYMVNPDPLNDRLNAEDYTKYKENKTQTDMIHLTLSATFPNLQEPQNNIKDFNKLEEDFPGAFRWAGEINVFKHALAGNGFFANGKRVTYSQITSGSVDPFFAKMEEGSIPVTLHCDLGCDNYDALTFPQAPLPIKMCETPLVELTAAAREHLWWKEMLGVHYPAFFNEKTNKPNPGNFRKVMHLRVWDAILERYPNVNIIWAHVGLSKELKNLHPLVHIHVLTTLFNKHANLYADVSWDVLPKQLLMNYKNDSVAKLMHTSHEDFDKNAAHLFNHTAIHAFRDELHEEVWSTNKARVHATGSDSKTIGGPTYAMAMYLSLLNEYSDRFVTGTDFVASLGQPRDYPGLPTYKNPPSGCMKNRASHARQLTDTSTINMFLDDQAFSRIVLGENYFKLTGLDDTFWPPPVCGAETGLSTGAIIGIVVGILLVVLLLAIIIGFLVYRAKQ